MDDPFLLFPEEVWELILDRVTDPKDAWNLLKAYPQLDTNSALQSKKRVWLFGLVIPHLIQRRRRSWIKEQDLLNCRLVSQTWSIAVTNFLENQPQLREYIPAIPVPGGPFPWSTKTFLQIIDRRPDPEAEDEDEDALLEPGVDMLRNLNQILCGTVIKDLQGENESLRRFLREMRSHSHGISPFLSTFLSLRIGEDPYSNPSLGPNFPSFLFNGFGHHIVVFQLDFDLPDLSSGYLVNCLNRLPNLKCLHLIGRTRRPNLIPEISSAQLPVLPALVALRIQYSSTKLGHLLISRYSSQIRKLQLDIGLWREEYFNLFPYLAEFEAMDVKHEECDRLRNILLSIHAPCLAKLMIKSKFYDTWEWAFGKSKFWIETDIFQWMRRFPNIRYFNLGEEGWISHCVEEGTLTPEKDSIPSLQFLSIRTSPNMNYNFLRCLPSLQHLQLHVTPKPIVIDHSTNPTIRIMEEIQTATIYRSNVWELLPNLKTVTLLTEDYLDRPFQICSFTRERYEYGRKNGSIFNSPGEFAKLRRDITDFLLEETYNSDSSGSESEMSDSSSDSEISTDSEMSDSSGDSELSTDSETEDD